MTKGKTAVPGVTLAGAPDRRRRDPDAPFACVACGRLRAATRFPFSARRRADGTRYRRRSCADCLGVASNPKRRPRYDGHGRAWCSACKRYRLVDDFRPHPQRPGRLWPYCYECCRAIDRIRWRGERKERLNRRRTENERKQAEREHAERIAFVKTGIETLRRRGLTLAETARLADTTFSSIRAWERGDRRVTPNAAKRIRVLLAATSDWPIGATPATRRRLPHPRYAELATRVAPAIAAYPLRSRWKSEESIMP